MRAVKFLVCCVHACTLRFHIIQTFSIFRELRNVSQLIRYDDNGNSLEESSFDPSKPLKVLIHGFKGSGRDKGALGGVQAFLQLVGVPCIFYLVFASI